MTSTRPVGRPELPKPGLDQGTLDGLDDPAPFAGKPGAVVEATRGSVAAALDLGMVDAKLDAALGVLAVEVARAVDVAARRSDPYGVTTAARELRSILARLGLDPAARQDANNDNGLADLLADLGKAEVCDPPQS